MHVPYNDTCTFLYISNIILQIISGSDPIEIRTAPVIQVSLTLAVSIDQFFTQNLISNLAYVLNINPSSIRVVNIIAESATVTGKRSLLAANDSSTLTLELGAPPPNVIDVPAVPSVEEQIDQSGGLGSVDMTVSCNDIIVGMTHSRPTWWLNI